VIPQIFFPADLSSDEFSMRGYADLFAHLKKKTFSAFFLHDFTEPLETNFFSGADRSSLQHAIEEEAELLELDINFFNPGVQTTKALVHRSRFADLVVINPFTMESLEQFSIEFPENFFEQLACPVLLSPSRPPVFDEILILFDYDLSALIALKSFLQLFEKVCKNNRITVLMVSASERPELLLESYFINYVKTSFVDVGVTPLNGANVYQQLITMAGHSKKPLIIMGKNAIQLLHNKAFITEMVSHEISLFYSNG
jgi:hypothetical protein